MKRIKLFENFNKINEISTELVRKTAKKMGEYGQLNRGKKLINNQYYYDIKKIFKINDKFGKNKLEAEYYIGYWEIEEGDYGLVPVIFLYKKSRFNMNHQTEYEYSSMASEKDYKTIKYFSTTDEFSFDSSKFDKNSIILNRQEARKLCELAKLFNPNTKYATGTKDLPVEDYI